MISERALSKCALAEYPIRATDLIMKMFSLIDVGERAGTGVPDVFATWANAGLPEPRIEEKFGEADRTILTLMLESDAKLYQNEHVFIRNEQIIDNNEQLNGPK